MANSFGKIFKFTTWGESHGDLIGCVIDGVPSLIPLTENDIQQYLDKRKPGQKFTSPRNESDIIKIASGIFNGLTTGVPISLIIENTNHNSKDYEAIKDKFRPGHADYTYQKKYGIRDYRGGGRASARETALRVAAGAIARKIIGSHITIKSAMIQLGPYPLIDKHSFDWQETSNNIFSCPCKKTAFHWQNILQQLIEKDNSIGAIIETHVSGLEVGLGAPIYDKLDSDLAAAIMSINAIKGVEIGDGFGIVNLLGDQALDQMEVDSSGNVSFLSNHNGGILGGISTGQDIVIRYAVKPTSSIKKNLKTIDLSHTNTTIQTYGRHDPCIGIRAIPVAEAMIACVLADHLLLNKSTKL